ncbi:MAG: DedA family protein [Acidobacteria bacterium]|nr:DedA family protein [Acidobacteriota bacterium]
MDSWIVDMVKAMGLWGVALLMFVENVFPPIPSELIMPLAGYLTIAGDLRVWPAILAGSFGSLAGASLWYFLAKRYSKGRFRSFIERRGVWFAMDLDDLDRAQSWFERHGKTAVFVGRLVPGIRTLISVPAGLSGMGIAPFLLWSALGTFVWTAFLTFAGRFLGQQFEQLEQWIGPISWVVLGGMLVWYVVGVVRKMRKSKRGERGAMRDER